MLRFVGTGSDGLPLKRSQSQHACEPCRKRKKRCNHNVGQDHRPSSGQQNTSRPRPAANSNATLSKASSSEDRVATVAVAKQLDPRQITNHTSNTSAASPSTGTTPSTGAGIARHDEPESARFVGDLNPEATFLAATTPETTNGPRDDNVGVWVPGRASTQVGSWTSHMASPASLRSSNVALSYVPTDLLHHLQIHCSRILPGPDDFRALYLVFCEDVQPILPVINLQAFDDMTDNTPSKTILKQTICLAVSSNPRVKDHLRLYDPNQDDRTVMSPKTFARTISYAILTLIDHGFVQDKLVAIQVLTLLSMFTQLSDDRHSSAELAARAISYVHTVGIHLDTVNTRDDHVYVTQLFCCVYALDRLNAAFHGRPVMMHERDIGRNLKESISQQHGAFHLLLQIVSLLDSLIVLYRPGATGIGQEFGGEFPAFEDLLDISSFTRISAHLLATVETLYHATAMLSNRPQLLTELSRSSPSHLRQVLSATSITSIVGSEFKGQLSLFPFVPYAVSLSLRVFYRELRVAKSPFLRARARRRLINTCDMLRNLGDVFTTCMMMVELAEQTVKEMDKVYVSMVTQQQDTTAEASNNRKVGANPTTHDYSNPDQTQDNNSQEAAAAYIPHQTIYPNTTTSITDNQSFDSDQFDPTLFDGFPDLDVFDRFDPDFNLDAIDAALANSIDPTCPTSLIDFGR